jgi:hypothetical protein
MALLILSLAGPLLAAWFGLCFFWPVRRPDLSHYLLRLCLTAGLALGVSSCFFYLWLAIFGPARVAYVSAEGVLYGGVIVAFLWGLKYRQATPDPDPLTTQAAPGWLTKVLAMAFLGVLGFALVNVVFIETKSSHGWWDAWSIWNLRARFLFRGGEHWADAFSPNLQHPDYPLLLPAAVARCWLYVGEDATLVPAGIGVLFTLATAGLLCTSLAVLRDASQGFLAGILLLGTPAFLSQGGSQCADVPLAFFFLAALVLLTLGDRVAPGRTVFPALAGLMAGCAAWTKNEGLLFVGCVPLARLAAVVPRRGWKAFAREMAQFGLGLLPLALTLIYFKSQHAPPNDLVAGQDREATLERLTDFSRYRFIGYILRLHLVSTIIVFNKSYTFSLLILAVSFFLLGRAGRAKTRVGITSIALVAVMMFAGYMGAYVVTPHPLDWHLGTSLDRVLLHLWPLVLLGFFLCTKTPEEALAANPEPEPAPPGVP